MNEKVLILCGMRECSMDINDEYAKGERKVCLIMKKEGKYIVLFKLRKFCLFLCGILSLHHILGNHSLLLTHCIIFTMKKGNDKLEERKEQEKEEMVLFSIKIR